MGYDQGIVFLDACNESDGTQVFYVDSNNIKRNISKNPTDFFSLGNSSEFKFLKGSSIRSSGNHYQPGTFLLSENKKYAALFQEDGNFVVYDHKFNVVQDLGTQFNFSEYHDEDFIVETKFLAMQSDGNLVIYRHNPPDNPKSVWASDTCSSDRTDHLSLKIANDGTVYLEDVKTKKFIKLILSGKPPKFSTEQQYILSESGHYLCVTPECSLEHSKEAAECEKFSIKNLNQHIACFNQIAIKDHQGRYLSCSPDGEIDCANKLGPWEQLYLQTSTLDGKFRIKDSHGRYFSVSKNGDWSLQEGLIPGQIFNFSPCHK